MCRNCGKPYCRGCTTRPETNQIPEISKEELARIRELGRKAVEDGENYLNAWSKVGNLGKKGF